MFLIHELHHYPHYHHDIHGIPVITSLVYSTAPLSYQFPMYNYPRPAESKIYINLDIPIQWSVHHSILPPVLPSTSTPTHLPPIHQSHLLQKVYSYKCSIKRHPYPPNLPSVYLILRIPYLTLCISYITLRIPDLTYTSPYLHPTLPYLYPTLRKHR